MAYHLCYKKNDKNLLHIIRAKDLKKPLFAGYTSIAKCDEELDAYKKVAELIEDFCQTYWDKGKNPDFGRFPAWVRRAML